MLLSSVLRILSQNPTQPKPVEKAEKADVQSFKIEDSPVKVDVSKDLKQVQQEIATENGLLRPVLLGSESPYPSLQDLIQAVAKFEKEESKRVVDVFK